MKKSLIAAALLGASLSPAVAMAQEVPATVSELLAVGATVYGPNGAEVGKIEKLADGNVVIFTGTNRATLPATSIGRNDKGLLIGMTKEQLDSAVAAASAKADAAMTAALVPDAQITSTDGVVVGTVQKVEGENVTVDLSSGSTIALPKNQLHATASGGLGLFVTAAEFTAAVNSAASAPAAPADAASPADDAEPAEPAAN